MANRIYIDDVGTIVILDLAADVTTLGGPVVTFKVTEPDDNVLSWTASPVIGEANQWQFTLTVADGFSKAGTHTIYALITDGATDSQWTSEAFEFTIYTAGE